MFSYSWQNLIDLVKRQVKGIPTQPLDALQCDFVSGEMAQRLPWKFVDQTIADGQIPLVDGVQDYDPPFNIFRLTSGRLTCTSSSVEDDVDLNVRDWLATDLYKRSPYAITSVSLQSAVGQLRLSSAVIIPEGQTWELRGSYQINPTKIIDTSQIIWFDDRYANVAVEGLKYWYFQLADDPRAGGSSGVWPDAISYSGQFGQFMTALKRMASSEDQGGDMQVMPESALGQSSNQYGAMVAGYGTGGNGNGSQSRGLVSLNGDTTPAQHLVGGYGIAITQSAIGSQLISYTGGVISGGQPVNFADNVLVNGSGTAWNLPFVPNPAASLQLFQQLPGFGQILLKPGVDYTLAGQYITTTNSITAGTLSAFFRY